MSSFAFEDTDAGPSTPSPYLQNGTISVGFNEPWKGEHRWTPIAGMVGWRKSVEQGPDPGRVTDWWDNGSSAIAFGRGSRGFVVINREDSEISRRFQTGMPPGRYCNVLRPGCEETIDVGDDGVASFAVPAARSVAIHVNAEADSAPPTPESSTPSADEPQPSATGTFSSGYPEMYIRGTFNGWSAQEMELVADNVWRAEVVFTSSAADEFKFDVYGDWRLNFGAGGRNGGNIRATASGPTCVEFNDQTLRYEQQVCT
mmetsp:Transcript_4316/g.13030  ORF Transcript_4316/g.13030 Transcript_4316/m.13030 type:complete len:258 (+) Transcript_4316:1385-2158(+)